LTARLISPREARIMRRSFKSIAVCGSIGHSPGAGGSP
jgi:hypothetical protein